MSIARVAFAFDAGTAAVMRALLESRGIATLDIARGGHVAIAGADQGFYLEVLDEDAARARRLLGDHDFGKYLVAERPAGRR